MIRLAASLLRLVLRGGLEGGDTEFDEVVRIGEDTSQPRPSSSEPGSSDDEFW